jgi:tRNA A-37 threonylcarbamoyl transferase component Bud32
MSSGAEGGGPDHGKTTDPLVGRVVLGRYRLGRRLGAGGMGSVYEAEQLAVGRTVAVKVLRTDLVRDRVIRDRFRREAEITARLRHPHTVSLIDYGESDDGLVVIVMELLVGRPLDALLRERGGLTLDETFAVGEQIAGSLVEAHAAGLVHRDLKPANVFVAEVSGAPFCKVLDFGIARILDEDATRLTATGQIFGTPRYMSPEQAASTGDVDARSDLYSLGLILYECATGDSPFRATTALQYLAAHTTQVPTPLGEVRPDAPPAFAQLVLALLQKAPEDRPADAESVRRALAALRARTPSVAAPPSEPAPRAEAAPREGSPAPARPGRWWALVAAAGITAGLGGVGLWSAGSSSLEPAADEPAVVPLDAGFALDAAPVLPDAAPDARTRDAAPPTVDAGLVDARPDLGARPSPDAGRPPRRRRPRPRSGVVSGPRGMTIELDESAPDFAALAAGCSASEWSGLSALTTVGCPDDCAILVDQICAGRTPARGRAVAPGRREVVVVCAGKPQRRRTLRFREGQTHRFDCR